MTTMQNIWGVSKASREQFFIMVHPLNCLSPKIIRNSFCHLSLWHGQSLPGSCVGQCFRVQEQDSWASSYFVQGVLELISTTQALLLLLEIPKVTRTSGPFVLILISAQSDPVSPVSQWQTPSNPHVSLPLHVVLATQKTIS